MRMTIRRRGQMGLGLACVIAALTLVSHSAIAEERLTGTTMGPVRWNVTVVSLPDSLDRNGLHAEIDGVLDRVDFQMSTYRSDSEVSRFNRSDSVDWHEVSPETATVVARALELSADTDGAFDITIAPLVNLWSFGAEEAESQVPSEDLIAHRLNQVGYQHLFVRVAPPALRKSMPELTIDLSAIAKGFAVDQVARRLDELNITDYLVEVGGEVRTRGKNDRGDTWVIGIETPYPSDSPIVERVRLANRCMATSGDYRNFFVVDGKRYSHTIDPRTGRPAQNKLTSVTIVAGDCMTADAWATAMLVLGPDEIDALCAAHNLQAFWIQRDGSGYSEDHTSEFPLAADGPEPDGGVGASWMMVGAAFVVFAVALIGMSVGVIFSNRRIKGSCGGLAALKEGDLSAPCEICEVRSKCDEFREATEASCADDG